MTKTQDRIKYGLSFLLAGLLAVLSPALGLAAGPNHQAARAPTCASIAIDEGIEIEATLLSHWGGGASYEMRITNKGGEEAGTLTLGFILPGAQKIDPWGVEADGSLPRVSVDLPEYAAPLAPGETWAFAFNVYPGTQPCGLRILESGPETEETPTPEATPSPTPPPSPTPSPTPEEVFDMEDPFDGEIAGPNPIPGSAFAPPLSTQGAKILNAYGSEVTLRGVNWFGMETETYAPHGLWARPWGALLQQIADEGFNTIRIPFGQDSITPGRQPSGIDFSINPDLEGLSSLEILDLIVERGAELGIYIILDRHSLWANHRSPLWYSGDRGASPSANPYGEEAWIQGLESLARRYRFHSNVVGIDLHNEPHGAASWGTGAIDTDWRLAAQRAGNRVLSINPTLLILIEGVEGNVTGSSEGSYWWGGNLTGVRSDPVRLNIPGRVVYSPHAYGAGVYGQPWFYEPSFPANLQGIWDQYFGYIAREGIAPVLVGEFGGWSADPESVAEGSTEWREAVWQEEMVAYQVELGLSGTYWSLNPNSGDTGGFLWDDWKSVVPEKRALLGPWLEPPPLAPPGS